MINLFLLKTVVAEAAERMVESETPSAQKLRSAVLIPTRCFSARQLLTCGRLVAVNNLKIRWQNAHLDNLLNVNDLRVKWLAIHSSVVKCRRSSFGATSLPAAHPHLACLERERLIRARVLCHRQMGRREVTPVSPLCIW